MRANNTGMSICGVVFAASLLGSVAVADDTKPEVRFGFDVEPKLTAKYKVLRDKAVAPRRSTPKLDVKETFVFTATLTRFDDGMVLLARPITEAQTMVLRRLGAVEVEDEENARNHTICKGTYYRAYQAPEVEGVVLKGLTGLKVKAEVVRTQSWSYVRTIMRAS